MQSNKTTVFDAIIIGAGISGVFCALQAAHRGKKVLLLEKSHKALRKLLVTGGGKCNFSNKQVQSKNYFGRNEHFCHSALKQFSNEELYLWLRQRGLRVEEREHGQLFCKRSSEDIHSLLLNELAQTQCQINYNSPVRQVNFLEKEQLFSVQSMHNIFYAHALVLATGSPAWPQTGATDVGIALAKKFKHTSYPFQAVLVGLKTAKEHKFGELAGISLQVRLSCKQIVKNKTKNITTEILPLLFTHSGISGPVTLQISLYCTQNESIVCDFLPNISEEELAKDFRSSEKMKVRNFLHKYFPNRFIQTIFPSLLMEKRIAELAKKDFEHIIKLCKHFSISITGTEGWKKAEAALGGLNTDEFSSKTMESALRPGLFACGELLDVTGQLGGYNIQWAFSSAFVAGNSL